MISIKHRFTSAVICSYNVKTLREAVLLGVKNGVDLSYADLRSANLRSADFRYANLRSANLSYANLSYADLSYADLRSADFRYADLRSANLRSANLSYANLSYADLRSADLRSANLRSALGLEEDSLAIKRTLIVPDGDLVGWKKLSGGVIAKLKIPEMAKRTNAVGSRKCRAEFAFVIGLSAGNLGYDSHTGKCQYNLGRTVYPDSYNPSRTEECTNGIHFFLTREEAEAY